MLKKFLSLSQTQVEVSLMVAMVAVFIPVGILVILALPGYLDRSAEAFAPCDSPDGRPPPPNLIDKGNYLSVNYCEAYHVTSGSTVRYTGPDGEQASVTLSQLPTEIAGTKTYVLEVYVPAHTQPLRQSLSFDPTATFTIEYGPLIVQVYIGEVWIRNDKHWEIEPQLLAP